MRRQCRVLIPLLAVVLALSACGGDEEGNDKAAPADGRTMTDEIRTQGTTPERRDVAGARREVAEEKQRKRDLKELEQDREFDRSFATSRFDRLVDRLPIRKPPLHVEQYITGDDHRIHAAVSRKRFCRLPVARREQAVESFFESADRVFRRAEVDDLEVVVTALSEKIDNLPALATATRDRVRLTSRGRSC